MGTHASTIETPKTLRFASAKIQVLGTSVLSKNIVFSKDFVSSVVPELALDALLRAGGGSGPGRELQDMASSSSLRRSVT